ncbi:MULTISPECIES: DUF4260 family protein [unclassified Sporosarcina]|uniref:DUF4260 family protein n=1 Tax=unclassified Sporosarcina TaxID=2647733 RepID=UPI0020413EF1|nr:MULTISPECIES: DUF4260 family protein [unclassified Sporosarcina]
MSLRKWIHFEYAVGFLVCLSFYIYLDYSILLFVFLLLVPDIFMIGYLFSKKTGSTIYNLGHSITLPILLILLAVLNEFPNVLMAGVIWLAHICLDRSLGFGLKYERSFKDTHLQRIE